MRYTYLLVLVSLLFASCNRGTNDPVMCALVGRLIPVQADRFVFEQITDEDESDFFELESAGNQVIIRGNNSNSMAVGLNYYLKYYCMTTVSWYVNDPVEMPEILPPVPQKVKIAARTKNRFFLNYCTFGYTMPWWKWEDWERLIDWMALNGINMPLAITGQEAVWYNVWQKLGLEDEEIRNYFTGPPYLPWHRMSNLDYWQGPLPKEWLDNQVELQKKIVTRERELNMKPILPAFAGHVPQELNRLYPDAKITRMSKWGGFDDEYRSSFLSPDDPLFATIQKEFLTEQTRLFGTNHIYGADPFNEVEPPSWQEDSLAVSSDCIYKTIAAVDSEAVWLQMTWLFYMDRHLWTDSRIKAFLTAVPQGKMQLLDYYCEDTEVWKQTGSYHGQPFIWCYLGNFGGNTMLAGNLKEVGERIERVYRSGGENFSGLGSTLEALDVNPYIYEYVFEKAWDYHITDVEWMNRLADRRTGRPDTLARKAWRMLYDKVYTQPAALGQGTLTNTRPSLEGHGNWTTVPNYEYDNKDLFIIWEMLLNMEKCNRDTYLFDIVNIGRQVLGNHFMKVRNQFTDAYKQKNVKRLKEKGEEMKQLLWDMNKLVSGHTTFSLNNWISDARDFGTDAASKDYYERNARNLITTWGDKDQSLNDYANRSWAGLITTYYAPRWNTFIDETIAAVETGQDFNQQKFHECITAFEINWVNTTGQIPEETLENVTDFARFLLNKYNPLILNK